MEGEKQLGAAGGDPCWGSCKLELHKTSPEELLELGSPGAVLPQLNPRINEVCAFQRQHRASCSPWGVLRLWAGLFPLQ